MCKYSLFSKLLLHFFTLSLLTTHFQHNTPKVLAGSDQNGKICVDFQTERTQLYLFLTGALSVFSLYIAKTPMIPHSSPGEQETKPFSCYEEMADIRNY